MPVYTRVKSVIGSGVTSLTASFDETSPLSSSYSLVAVLYASTLPTNVTSNSWGATALSGSGNNGSLNFLAAYLVRGDASKNSVTFNFGSSVTNSRIDLYAFKGHVSLTPDTTSGSSGSGLTSLTISSTDTTTKSNVISIAAVSLSGSGAGFSTFSNGFEQAASTSGLMTSAARAYTASGVLPSTTVSWTTSRNTRSSVWNIEGVAESTSTTTPPSTDIPGIPENDPDTGTGTLPLFINGAKPLFSHGGKLAKSLYLGTKLLGSTTTTPPIEDPGTEDPGTENPGTEVITLGQDTMPTYAQAWTLASAPTITYLTSSSLSGSMVLPTDSKLKYTGHASRGINKASDAVYYRPNYLADISTAGEGNNPFFLPMYGIKLKTNSSVIEVKLRQRPDLAGKANINSPIAIRVKIDGQWTSRRPTYVGPTAVGFDNITKPDSITSGTEFWVKLNFGSTTTREIEIVTMTEFGGFKLNSGATYETATAPKFTAVVLGDSINGAEKHGTGNFSLSSSAAGNSHKATYNHLSSLWSYMCQTIGYDNVVNSAVGSTGFNISGETVKYVTTSRITQDVVAFKPQMVMVGTSFNDLAGGQSVATVQSVATNTLSTIRASLPTALIIVLGNPNPPVAAALGGASAITPYNTALKAAAKSVNAWFLDPILGDLFNPSGTVVVNKSDMISGNTQYISSDLTHPTQPGADFFGSGYIADMVRAAHPLKGATTTTPPVIITPPTDPDPDPETPPVEPPPITGQSYGVGPHSVDWTPRTLARNERADRTFLAASLSKTDIEAAMKSALAWNLDNPTKDAEVTLPDGTWYGDGAGATDDPAIDSIGNKQAGGAANQSRRIRVRPAGPYGSVKISQNRKGDAVTYDNNGNIVSLGAVKIKNTHGFTFSELYGNESAFVFQACKNNALEYSHDLAYWGINDGRDGQVDLGYIDIVSTAYSKSRVKNGDALGITNLNKTKNGVLIYAGEPLPGLSVRNSLQFPVRIGLKDTWGLNSKGVPEKPHSDMLQIKGNAPVGLFVTNSLWCAAQNCVLQMGGNGTVNVQDSYFFGGEDWLNQYAPSPKAYYPPDSTSVFQVFNGDGTKGHTSRRMYVQGGMSGSVDGVPYWVTTGDDVKTSLATETMSGWTIMSSSQRITPTQAKAIAPLPDFYKLWAGRY